MHSPDELDARLDGLALIECAHRDDLSGARVILDHGSPRLIAAFLARVGADLIEAAFESPDDALAWLREHHA